MFVLNHKYDKELTKEERLQVIRLAAQSGVELNNVWVKKNTKLSWRKNVACFSMLTPDVIYVCDDNDITSVFPALAHEIKHREQFHRMGFLVYSILAFPLWRLWTIEPEAYAEEDRVELLRYDIR